MAYAATENARPVGDTDMPRVVVLAFLLAMTSAGIAQTAGYKKQAPAAATSKELISIGSLDFVPEKADVLARAHALTSATVRERLEPRYLERYTKLCTDARKIKKEFTAEEISFLNSVPKPDGSAADRLIQQQHLREQRRAHQSAQFSEQVEQTRHKEMLQEEWARADARRKRQQKIEALQRKREMEKITWGPDEMGDRAREFFLLKGEDQ